MEAVSATILADPDTDDVFEPGRFDTNSQYVKTSDATQPPTELFIVAPETQGPYPVLLFFHGFLLRNSWYSNLLKHIASHGYIVVAPAIYGFISFLWTSQSKEVKIAADVARWISSSLPLVLQDKVKPDLDKIALSGHSRGGKTAFALQLHAEAANYNNSDDQPSSSLLPTFKAIIGVDPSAGISILLRTKPHILNYIPRSFDISIPVALIGAGLSNQPMCLIPPFAPNGCNHSEFFNESKPPSSYFLAKDYGHCDMLDDWTAVLTSLICKSGKGAKDLMRRGVAGIVVALLQAYLGDDDDHLNAIVDQTTTAPITLDPIIYLKE